MVISPCNYYVNYHEQCNLFHNCMTRYVHVQIDVETENAYMIGDLDKGVHVQCITFQNISILFLLCCSSLWLNIDILAYGLQTYLLNESTKWIR